MGYRRPTLFAALAILAVGALVAFLYVRRPERSAVEDPGLPPDLFPTAPASPPSPVPSDRPAPPPPATLDETLERLERLRPDDAAGYEALEAAAAKLLERDPAAFVAYFRRAIAETERRTPRRSFFLVKLVIDSSTLPGDAPVAALVAELLARKPEPGAGEHDGPPTLSLVKTFALHGLSERLPPAADRQKLVPTLERLVRQEPDLAVAREAAILLTRIQDDRGAAVKRLLRGRSKEDREAFEDLAVSRDRETLEKYGAAFESERLLSAQRRTWEAVREIAAQIGPGMRETEAVALANRVLDAHGARKRWHRSCIRFGANTVIGGVAPSPQDVTLGESDVFYVDIGPVFDGYEGDAGQTFVVGADPEMRRCAEDGRAVFAEVRHAWKSQGWTGERLYRHAEALAAARGWQLIPDVDGHRLSDFPHHLYYRGPLGDLSFSPSPGRWVLEIQLRHPSRPFGSFHEDLLV